MLQRPITLKKIRTTVLVLSLMVLSGGLGYFVGQGKVGLDVKKAPYVQVLNRDQPPQRRMIDFSLFWQVWDELEKSYIAPQKIDSEKMVYGAISGMTASLDDPYTVFLPPEDNKQNKENLSGTFYGVGIQIGFKNEHLAVIAPLEGMPAERAGVKAGDLIIGIRDIGKELNVEDMRTVSLPEAVTMIRGEKGTKVTLVLLREGEEEPREIEVVREEIVIPSVELVFLNSKGEEVAVEKGERKVAHLKLTQFGERTQSEWEEVVNRIVSYKGSIEGIILDVRNNPGGYLSGSVDIASEFLKDGTVVVQQGRERSETFGVEVRGRLTDIPLVVLINKGSASASEIVAGALRDRLGVVLVGEKTFGKGTVQEAKDLAGGAGLHVTTSEWILPSGKKINGEGLTPDVVVEQDEESEDSDEQLLKAIELLIE